MCEKCYLREAVFRCMPVVGDAKTTLNLCRSYAKGEGADIPLMDMSRVFGKMIIAILTAHLSTKIEKGQEGFSEEQKTQVGNIGMIIREETGVGTSSIETLKTRLQQAIDVKAYERAAALRDENRRLERSGGIGST